ncbi:uncharacterized protein LAESUDRAFT_745453 [Laetiporus sulphureus 93-53]|uniref:Fatty acid desaturase domain-containing protein n=1 Tax=Laetiporus sulphureus 93-53 TaxID=1314785 RepID=A0A165BMW8_9APHY|nr:uncharacterized protein LAESUDRAFT_745453 [Laetiporus sulphureus 93-53]KZT01329.1 hypothetical protein LAESUDRAFT_745453 [Laetiporus sulphureus 93-53]
MVALFKDSPEYEARKKATFTPPNITIKDVHAAVPKHLFQRSTSKAVFYVVRHLSIAVALFVFATKIDSIVHHVAASYELPSRAVTALSYAMWSFYWLWESVTFTGVWTLGHECGHDALAGSNMANAVLGMIMHTFMLTPYYAWRATHRSHHKGTNSLARDETYHPPSREDFHLPEEHIARPMDYHELVEETPLYTLYKMLIRQFLGFQLYLIHNRKGNPKYPPWTSHYNPNAQLFRPEERHLIAISDVAMAIMVGLLGLWIHTTSFNNVWRLYFVPWLFAHSWIVTITYLQHSDPTVPYYRNQWTFLRGALATVDRPMFGWVGRFFWHGIAHDHVAHHFFVTVPFYNLPQVTEAIKPVLGEYYYYDTTPTFYALWRSFTQCKFIESKGDIVFFKNQQGKAVREDITDGSHVAPPAPALQEEKIDVLSN